tara:strand:+ start:41 stop:898 length:858 start_codon:yes stop_codon:yes gene_type:complete
MKKVSFDSSGEEKNRILEMHQKSTGRQYLNLIKEEKQQLNEWIWWALGGAALIAGGIKAYNWEGTDANKSVKALHDSCKNSKLGKPLQSSSQLEKIVIEVGEALREKTMGFMPSTNEEGLKSALLKIKSIPDYCKVASEYELKYGEDMYEGIDGDIDFGDWDTYVRQPLGNAIKASSKINDDATKKGGGGEEGNDKEGSDEEGTKTPNGDTMVYNSCSGTYKLGCKDEDDNVVWQLQGCLGLKQTGKFGPNTESSLKEKTGNTSIDEREVWTLCKNEIPGEIALY